MRTCPYVHEQAAIEHAAQMADRWNRIYMRTLRIFRMIALATELELREEPGDFAEFDDMLEFVAAYFLGLLEERIRGGLYRSYVEREDNLHFVRGRMEVAEDLRRNFALRHRTSCSYTDFTWDVPENQILRQAVHVLSLWGFSSDLGARLMQADRSLAEVTPTRLRPGMVDTFRYNRHNTDYRQLHQFCKLFIEGASLHEEQGPIGFRPFLVDMNKLFESFITQLLLSRAPTDMAVFPQAHLYLDEGARVEIRPDMLISSGKMWMLAADCKYKRLNPTGYKNHDIYQLLAYCTALSVNRGLLIYPLAEAARPEEIHIRALPPLL